MLYFITGNKNKISSAKLYLSQFNIEFEPKDLPLVEIQSKSIEEIAIHKAKSAFEMLKQPLFVKDDGWFIEGLNGFPGPYMRYVNEWFNADDFINLLKSKSNKTVTFHEVVCYTDGNQIKTFSGEIKGKIVNKPKGTGVPFTTLCTFRNDNKTMAEAFHEGLPAFDDRTAWLEFVEWLKGNIRVS